MASMAHIISQALGIPVIGKKAGEEEGGRREEGRRRGGGRWRREEGGGRKGRDKGEEYLFFIGVVNSSQTSCFTDSRWPTSSARPGIPVVGKEEGGRREEGVGSREEGGGWRRRGRREDGRWESEERKRA
jgi:hypothetical protein